MTKLAYLDAKPIKWSDYLDWSNGSAKCPWCDVACELAYHGEGPDHYRVYSTILECPNCGWWAAKQKTQEEMPIGPGGSLQSVNGGRKYIASILKKFDPSSRDAALEELRQYLIRNYSDIREITPAKMEELVRAVYKDFLDCDVHYFTNNTFAPDGGIDLVALEGSDGVETAIQVKRRLSDVAESVSTVREFLGAMAIQGYRRGIFVTTGRFSKVAQTLPSRVTSIYGTEVALDLVDAEGFERLLRRTRYCSEDSHPWYYAIGKYRAAEAISWNAFMASGDEA